MMDGTMAVHLARGKVVQTAELSVVQLAYWLAEYLAFEMAEMWVALTAVLLVAQRVVPTDDLTADRMVCCWAVHSAEQLVARSVFQ